MRQEITRLSPLRNTTKATSINELATEQLNHFGIDPNSDMGRQLTNAIEHIYQCGDQLDKACSLTMEYIKEMDHEDRIALFNAKKFLSFQLAKLLDNFQNSFRKSYQHLDNNTSTLSAKSAYPIFDNVTAVFSATPVITRTATYIFACAEWVNDAFEGKELMLEIYSRLLNPTSIALANHIVDLEAGPNANEYLAWNFNSGMSAIDATLSHVLGYEDVLITSRNVYGGAHQLIHDWFAKPSNLNIAVETFDGETAEDFLECWKKVQETHEERLFPKNSKPKCAYLYLESPCNPHGTVLDVPAICRAAHSVGIRVILDATIATPFLYQPLQQKNIADRPDFVIHSYTKDLSGTGSVIAGCVIGKNSDMFIPKGDTGWENTMFWNVYYVKGAFLNADSAFEVMQGMRTLEQRMMAKCINTAILAKFLDSHPYIKVNCSAIENNKNHEVSKELLYLGLPAPLFTIDLSGVPKASFQRFFDCLSPVFGHMISLGQTNTIVSCPGLTTHSELNEQQQQEASIFPTTIRFGMGIEHPADLIQHIISTAKLTLDSTTPGFSGMFMSETKWKKLIKNEYIQYHSKHISKALNEETSKEVLV